jgi:restriction system protein
MTLPLLEFTSDGNVHPIAELRELLAERFELTEEERAEPLPSGTGQLFNNRVAWARTYLVKQAP